MRVTTFKGFFGLLRNPEATQLEVMRLLLWTQSQVDSTASPVNPPPTLGPSPQQPAKLKLINKTR
jgi:hypothetical protein